jgi:hypothetical protein
MRGWHAGGAANNTHISFEICEDALDDADYLGAVYEAAAELCAYLCKQYAIAPEAIICHSEGCAMGIASNHADVMHWFPRYRKTMDDFRQTVRNRMEEGTMAEKNEAPQWAVEEGVVTWAVENGIIRGDEDGRARWGEPITRVEAAALLYRLSKLAGLTA